MANRSPKSLNDMLARRGYQNDENNSEDGESQLPPGLNGASRQILERVKALKKVQLESLEVEAQFYEKVHELEMQFQSRFNQINDKRRTIVAGDYEPAANDCDVPLINDMDENLLQSIEQNAPVEQGTYTKGVPGFWYYVLDMTQVSDDIQPDDVPILKDYLLDISTELHSNPPGFSLLFHFAENPFFSNKVLKKYYQLQMEVARGDGANPFQYEGPIIVKCEGTPIEWYSGKDVTVKVVKKINKKGPQAGKPVTKTVSCDSFFNFFAPKVTEESPDMDAELEEMLHHDFETGQIIRDEIVPRAVLFFTGEAVDDDDAFEDLEDEDEDDQSQDSDKDDE